AQQRQDHHPVVASRQQPERRLGIRGGLRLHPRLAERLHVRPEGHGGRLHEQHLHDASAIPASTGRKARPAVAGSDTSTSVPCPGRRFTRTRPPCSSTIRKTTDSPSPVPSRKLVWNGSNALRICAALIPTPSSANETRTPSLSRDTVIDRTPPPGIALSA